MASADGEPARPHDAAPVSVAPAPPAASASPPPSHHPPPPPAAVAVAPPPQPPASSPSESPSAAAAAAPLQQNDDSGVSESETNDMSSQSPAAPAAHHGMPLGYPASISSVYLPVTSMPTGQHSPYPTTTSQPADAYRTTPVPVSAPMSLPSMRTMDSMSQQPMTQPPPHHSVSMALSAPLASVASAPAFYTHQSMALPSNYGLAHEAMTRCPTPHDPHILGSRAPKKARCQKLSEAAAPIHAPSMSSTANPRFSLQEIKRRTKTGCLTCRKRRIKCDETHPTCNNCKKSKRDCLGYDPIFRQQAGGSQTNSHIQPAPPSQPTVPSSAPCTTPRPTAAAGVRIGNSYGGQPSMLLGAYPSTPASALASTPGGRATTTASYNSPVSVTAPVAIKIEPGYERSPTIESTATHFPSPGPPDCKPILLPDTAHLRAKKMKINEIIDLLGPPPPPQQISHTEETFNEITRVYHEMYAGGLGAFFESTWYYFAESGKMTFPRDANLIEHMASFLKILEAVKANDHTRMAYSGALETRIVWELACTAHQNPDRANSTMRIAALPAEGDATEVRNRLRVVEALLCGDYLAANPLAPPVADHDQHRTRQFDFWYSLAEFVRKRDSPGSPQAVKTREDMLGRMRHLLDGRENRDVLYSIAVVRELAPNFDPGYGSTNPQHLDESDPKNRLAVASKFILDEAQVTGGTTNVVRRFSDIASRAFVNPGVNIARRA